MYTYIFGYDNSSMTSHMLMVIRNTKMFVALATLYSCIPTPVILHVLTAFTTYIVIQRLSKNADLHVGSPLSRLDKIKS